MIRHFLFCIAVALMLTSPQTASAQDARSYLKAINSYRAQYGLTPVRWNKQLYRAAKAHADDMVRRKYFSHTSPSGVTPGRRIRKANYAYCYFAENIARGQKTLRLVIAEWHASTSHRRAMRDRRARDFALARSANNTWVMVLGSKDC